MHVLILGGTRFAGRAVTDAALNRGDTVTLQPGPSPATERVT